jgi:hypothetical protein
MEQNEEAMFWMEEIIRPGCGCFASRRFPVEAEAWCAEMHTRGMIEPCASSWNGWAATTEGKKVFRENEY